jgi:hypothetical protein
LLTLLLAMKNEKWCIQLSSATGELAFAPAERDVYSCGAHARSSLLRSAEKKESLGDKHFAPLGRRNEKRSVALQT